MSSLPTPRRNEIWLVRLDKVRPAVVMTRDPMGQLLNAVQVVPLTTTERGIDIEVRFDQGNGLSRASVANVDNMEPVERSDFVRVIGNASEEQMSELCRALAIAVDCD